MFIFKYFAIFSMFVVLNSQAAATQAACSPAQLSEVKRLISPDIHHNVAFIQSLFTAVEAGTLKCQITTDNVDQGFSLGSCGYSYPKSLHKISFEGKNQAWTLTVREDRVECSQKPSYWLMNITTRLNAVKSMIYDDVNLFVQVENPKCANADNFQAVMYSYQNAADGKTVSKLATLDTSDTQENCTEQKSTAILELPLQKLKLDANFSTVP